MKTYLNLIVATLFAISGCTTMQDDDHLPFLDTTWNLVEIGNRPIQHPGPRIPHMRFETDKVTGFDGCNNFFGEYTLDDNKLTFGLLAATRMACPHINDFDMHFNKMLSMTSGYRINGNRLELLAEDRPLAGFIAAEQR